MMTAEDFIAGTERDLCAQAADILSAKPEQEKYLNRADIRALAATLTERCRAELGEAPRQIEVACLLAEAILAPMSEKGGLLRKVYTLTGGMKGTAAIISAVGTALGWSKSVIAIVIALYLGTSLAGALGVTALVGYFLFNGSHAEQADKALNVLRKGVQTALREYFKTKNESHE